MEFEVVNEKGSDLNGASPTIIKVVGCGGGGSNAVNRMIEAQIHAVDFIALNTDLQALNKSSAPTRIAIGQKITQGLGAGGDPSIGQKAAEEDKEAIKNILKGANMVFVTAGMGGGTGTGSAPVVARIAREIGALTVGIVTTPFEWEGSLRMELAKDGIRKLHEAVDSVIVIPNEKITKIFGDGISFIEQYKAADDLLRQSIEGMSTIITEYGTPNIDFADVRAAMREQGTALFGIGVAEGENRAVDAATKAINNPLLEDTRIDGAKHFLVNVRAGENFSINELREISNIVTAAAAPGYDLKPGIVYNPDMGDRISVTVIATGFDNTSKAALNQASQEVVTETSSADDNNVSLEAFEDILSGRQASSVSVENPGLWDIANAQEPAKSVRPEMYGTGTRVPKADLNDFQNTTALGRKRAGIKFDRK